MKSTLAPPLISLSLLHSSLFSPLSFSEKEEKKYIEYDKKSFDFENINTVKYCKCVGS